MLRSFSPDIDEKLFASLPKVIGIILALVLVKHLLFSAVKTSIVVRLFLIIIIIENS